MEALCMRESLQNDCYYERSGVIDEKSHLLIHVLSGVKQLPTHITKPLR